MQSRIYGGFWKRALARLIDLLIVFIPALIIGFMITGYFSVFKLKPSDNIFLNLSISALVFWLICSAYFFVLIATLGYTPGKRLFNLKVVNILGGRISWIDAIYRETIGRLLNEVFFIGYLVLAWTPQKTSFADLLCDTRVINSWSEIKVDIVTITEKSADVVVPVEMVSEPEVVSDELQEEETSAPEDASENLDDKNVMNLGLASQVNEDQKI